MGKYGIHRVPTYGAAKKLDSNRKTAWMTTFETICVSRKLYEPGKVDWNTAEYFYSIHISVYEAVERLERNKDK